MKMSVREVKSNDHPPDFEHVEFLVSFWSQKNSPSFLTVFLEMKEDMTSSKKRILAIRKAHEFLSKLNIPIRY